MVMAPRWRHDPGMALPINLHALDADALRQLLIAQDRELTWRQTKIDQLTHELSLHKRWRFGVKTERLPAEQAILAARHALYVEARERHPARWSRHTRNWSPAGPVTLNPERESVVTMAIGNTNRQPLAA